jgi:hypothetical protein
MPVDLRHKGSAGRHPGRRLVAQGGQLNTRPKGRTLNPESPRRPEMQEAIYYGVPTRKGTVRGQTPLFDDDKARQCR